MPPASFDFRLSVLGLDDVQTMDAHAASHFVSLVDPGTALPSFFATLDTTRYVLIEMHDALDASAGIRAPERRDALALCHFADTLASSNVSHMVIHCHMGRSRSAAAAAIILVRLGHSPMEVFERIRAVRDPVWPNQTLIEHGDDVLGCHGELLRACDKVRDLVRAKYPRWVDDPRPETIDAVSFDLSASSSTKIRE